MCNLKDFLKTGKLGKIHIGICIRDVIKILGKPELSTQIKPNIDIYKYGDLELTFDCRIIKQIKISLNHNSPQIPNQLAKEIWSIKQSTKIEDLLDIIDNYEISWRVHEKWSFDRQLCLVTEAEVLLYFDLDRREFQSLLVTTN
ncbi:hypothetical protein Riv7116_4389 [Rivularia sp. PCC 7116]|uniref:hypothetical protein n=1 Tax=Rivularia sp. PCC 7116 TaxID=373994 RepID=UPI00029EF4C4|nr:hypothetical protein [Rivularia sp. PCC 7116]AFY56811.1 hypothetical protein Riv7116_4389 [Rivularia sp. PCC 7116]